MRLGNLLLVLEQVNKSRFAFCSIGRLGKSSSINILFPVARVCACSSIKKYKKTDDGSVESSSKIVISAGVEIISDKERERERER